jgi:hypothetical protein
MDDTAGAAVREARYWQAEAVGPFHLADGTGLVTVGYATVHRSPLGTIVCITALAPGSVDWCEDAEGSDAEGSDAEGSDVEGSALDERGGVERSGGREAARWQPRGTWQWRPVWNLEHRAGSGVLEVMRPWRNGVWRGGERFGLPSALGEAEEVLCGDGWTALAACARVWGVEVRPVRGGDLGELAERARVDEGVLLTHLEGLPELG